MAFREGRCVGRKVSGRCSKRFAARTPTSTSISNERSRKAISLPAHCRVTGTHTGNTLGFAPTGREVDFHGVTIARVVGEQILEGWNCFDFLPMDQQLGVIPANPGA
jgi:hypothetical protein